MIVRLLWRVAAAVALAAAAATSAVAADSYPSRPVRIIVNTGPGGLVDVVTRLVAQRMSDDLKQPVIVENRAGGDGLIGIRYVKSAPADGYTLLASASTLAYQTAVKEDPGYALTDFTGIGLLSRISNDVIMPPCYSRSSASHQVGRA